MSLLRDIQKFQSSNLRHCDTVVLTSDGRRLLESKDEQGQYSRNEIGTNTGVEF